MLVMFALTAFGWLLFRAHTMSQISDMLSHIDLRRSSASLGFGFRIAALWIPLLAIEVWQYVHHDLLAPAKLRTGWLFLLYTAMLAAIVLFGVRSRTEFIYFQF
jgi:hypothetical protein